MSRALRFWELVVDRLPLKFAPDWLNNWLAWQYWKRVPSPAREDP